MILNSLLRSVGCRDVSESMAICLQPQSRKTDSTFQLVTTLTLDRALDRLLTGTPRASRSSGVLLRVEPVVREMGFAENMAGAYNERTFHHFLAQEQRRSERSNRSFVLLLAHLRPIGSFDDQTAARLFSAFSLRETDFVGWYREQRVAGAVLIQQSEGVSEGVLRAMVGRARERFRGLASAAVDSVKVRGFQIPMRTR